MSQKWSLTAVFENSPKFLSCYDPLKKPFKKPLRKNKDILTLTSSLLANISLFLTFKKLGFQIDPSHLLGTFPFYFFDGFPNAHLRND